MVLAIGFRARSKRGVQFSKWANRHLKQYLVKGFVMDDERLKNPDGRYPAELVSIKKSPHKHTFARAFVNPSGFEPEACSLEVSCSTF